MQNSNYHLELNLKAYFLIFIFLYSLFSFVAFSFNPLIWGDSARLAFSLFFFTVSFLYYAFHASLEWDKNIEENKSLKKELNSLKTINSEGDS